LGCYNQSTRSESVLIQTRLLRQFLINYPNPTRHVATSLETMVDIMRSGFMVELERIRLGEEAKASKTLDDDMGKTGGWAPRTTPEVSLPSLLLCHARPVRARGCPSSTFARTRLPCSSVMRALFAHAAARHPRSRARGCPAPLPVVHVRAHAAALLLCPSSTFARTRLPCSSVMRALFARSYTLPRSRAVA
jgi:hypothetical protein